MDDCMFGHTQKRLIEMRGFAGDLALGTQKRINHLQQGAGSAGDMFIVPKQVSLLTVSTYAGFWLVSRRAVR